MNDCREKILSQEYAEFVLDFPPEDVVASGIVGDDFCYQEVDTRVGILSVNRNLIPDLEQLSNYYLAVPDLLGLQQEEIGGGDVLYDPLPLIESGITRVQEEPLNLTGRGVILAFADTGINYRNRIFQREDGSSRILAIWDQTIQDGEPPEGFLYGTEYTREEIDRALQAGQNALEIVPSVDEDGHGTRMASVAAGSRLEGGSVYNSPAYQADILVVKLKPAKEYLREYFQIPDSVRAYSSTDVMMAIRYLDSFARAFQRPIVFCLGLGTNFRDHEGGGIFSRYLNAVASQRSRILVIAGGNEGNASHHYFARFPDADGENRTNRNQSEERMEIYVSEGVRGFLLEIWTDAPVNPVISIRTPGGEYIEPTSVLFQTNLRYQFVFEETIIDVYNSYIAQGSGDTLVLMRFENPTAGIWTIGVSDETQTPMAGFDAWLPISEFLTGPVYFLEPDPEVTLTTPSYVPDALTIVAYNSFDNSSYLNSGRGFGKDGRIKPDLAAPGVDITAVGNRLGTEPVIGRYTGSSLAASIAAGAAAQFAQWAIVDGNAPYIRSRELKNYFIRGAVRERNIEYPNPIWGYGRLNLYETFVNMENT